jgi:hypothetical protein
VDDDKIGKAEQKDLAQKERPFGGFQLIQRIFHGGSFGKKRRQRK